MVSGDSPRVENEPRSIAGVCEVRRFSAPGVGTEVPAGLLIELPHGATRAEHFETLRRRLRSRLPADLAAFFFVNTDVGTPECAARLARAVTADLDGARRGSGTGTPLDAVLILRSLIPRTFVDCNRVIDFDRPSQLTAAIPDYVRHPDDAALLRELHESYQAAAALAYRSVCARGGTAIQLHSFAPRSIDVGRVGADIVEVLRRAYAPERYGRWPLRPEVDLITRTDQDELLAPQRLVERVRACYARRGVEVAENATYRLHPASSGQAHAHRYRGQVLCVELRRDRLADPFDPFVEMTIGAAQVDAMATPLAEACVEVLAPAP